MTKPVLLIDAYHDPPGGARNFLGALTRVPTLVYRPPHQQMDVRPEDFSGVIISGSAASVAVSPPPWTTGFLQTLEAILSTDLPVLGVCFGHQAIAHVLAGPEAVRLSKTPEVGWYDIELTGADPLFEGFESPFRTFVSHMDEVVEGSSGLDVLAQTDTCAVHAFRVGSRPVWGVQFHAEMTLQEATRLVESRARKQPELGLEPERVLARKVDSSPLIERLMGNFLRAAGLADD